MMWAEMAVVGVVFPFECSINTDSSRTFHPYAPKNSCKRRDAPQQPQHGFDAQAPLEWPRHGGCVRECSSCSHGACVRAWVARGFCPSPHPSPPSLPPVPTTLPPLPPTHPPSLPSSVRRRRMLSLEKTPYAFIGVSGARGKLVAARTCTETHPHSSRACTKTHPSPCTNTHPNFQPPHP
jgi:hypothetical protein